MTRHFTPRTCLAALALAFFCVSLVAPARGASQSIRASGDLSGHDVFTVRSTDRNHGCGNWLVGPVEDQLLCESGCLLGSVYKATCSRDSPRSDWTCEAYSESNATITSLRAHCCTDLWGYSILSRCFVRYRLEPAQPSAELAPIVAGSGIPVPDRSAGSSECDVIRKLLNDANDSLEEELRLCRRDLHRAGETIKAQLENGVKPVTNVMISLNLVALVGIALLLIAGFAMIGQHDRLRELIEFTERQANRMRTFIEATERGAKAIASSGAAAKPAKQPSSTPA